MVQNEVDITPDRSELSKKIELITTQIAKLHLDLKNIDFKDLVLSTEKPIKKPFYQRHKQEISNSK